MKAAAALLMLGTLVVPGCSVGRRASLGGECEINSDCDAPLVCRIGFCRNECATSADCAAGLSCLLDENRLGICQLLEEASCTLPSECNAPLVCRFNQCTNECTEDRDCLGGARCRVDPLGNACIDPSSQPCVRDGECMRDEYCLSGRCRQQCFTDRDCRRGWRCDSTGALGRCYDPTVDAGPRDTGDAGSGDASGDAGGGDAGVPASNCTGGGPLSDVTTFDHNRLLGCAVVDGMTSGLTPGVYCWGQNLESAFRGLAPRPGLDNIPCATRLDFLGTTIWDEIVLAGSAGCVRAGSVVQCWGADDLGQIPDGVLDVAQPTLTPVPFAGGAIDLLRRGEAGGVFVRGVSNLFVWGTSNEGHLGDGTSGPVPHDLPFALPFALPVQDLASTSRFTCVAGTADVVCSPATFSGVGAPIGGPDAVGAGTNHVCATDGSAVHCWGGSNGHAELGTGDAVSTPARVLVTGLPAVGVLDVDLGGDSSCALLSDQTVWCWGAPGPIEPARGDLDLVLRPLQIMSGRTALRVDDRVTCALGVDRQILCVGTGSSTFLGYGTGTLPTVPVVVQL